MFYVRVLNQKYGSCYLNNFEHLIKNRFNKTFEYETIKLVSEK